jgi:hypothetical protein
MVCSKKKEENIIEEKNINLLKKKKLEKEKNRK